MSLEELLIRHEGLRLKPYRCSAGKLTIGVGRNLEDRGISEEEARYLLKNDIEECLKYAREFPFFESLTEKRKHVIVSMIFNLGVTKFREFKRTIGLIEAGKYAEASKAMLQSKWASQVGRRAQELALMMATG